VQLFYVVNGWAGRVAWVDEAARLFYVCALPLLWCGLAWLLLAAPRTWAAFSRRRILGAAGVSLLGAFLLWEGIGWASREIWSTPIFSPRPFVTHWVNLLVVEPNDNSYPCIEVLLASIAATLCWAASLRAGAVAWIWTLLYGVVRIFCGSNYPIDVLAGWLVGWAIASFSLALWRSSLRVPARDGGRMKWRRRHQAVLSLLCVAVFLGTSLVEMLGAPQALRRVQSMQHEGPDSRTSGQTTAPQTAPPPSVLPVDSDYGRQPKVEAKVRAALENLKLAHHLVDVEVAQVTVGKSPYRVASVSFEVQPSRPSERKEVALSAARIARAALAADPMTQNVDVLGVIFQTRHSESFGEGGGAIAPEAIKPLPVFTASIPRSKLVLPARVAWANASGVDDGLWLRARSRLFIDSQVLPRATQAPQVLATPIPSPSPLPTASPTPTIAPTPTVAPTVAPTPAPTAKPTAVPTTITAPRVPPIVIPGGRPKPQWLPKATPKPTAKIVAQPQPKPTPKPAAKPTAKPRVAAPNARRRAVQRAASRPKYLKRQRSTYRRYRKRRRG
jgi:membrane-associated phospholipid phosphatase/outer membrane biosynthesis protein TonB